MYRLSLSLWILLLILPAGRAQNRAPSVWLHYQDNYAGDILVNTLMVTEPSPTYTYYCALQWNAGGDGGGYCGIQEHPDGRNYIFSIWDPVSSDDTIRAVYTGEGTKTENFGGEGTGLKSWNFSLGWKTGQWYSFITRTWDVNGHTMFGFWVYDHTAVQWHHLVTMDFPVGGVQFSTTTGSFVEDWYGNGWNTRTLLQKEAWKHSVSNQSWTALTRAYFMRVKPDDGAANYIDNYDGGTEEGYFFMKSGGTVTPVTNASGTYLTLSNSHSRPPFAVGRITGLTTGVAGDTLRLAWQTDTATAPQFSWHLRVYDDSTYASPPLLRIDSVSLYGRQADTDISVLPKDREYYYRFYIHDLLNAVSPLVTGRFVYGSPVTAGSIKTQRQVSVWPNPATTHLHIQTDRTVPLLDVALYNTAGRLLQHHSYRNTRKASLSLNGLQGPVIIRITLDTETFTRMIVVH